VTVNNGNVVVQEVTATSCTITGRITISGSGVSGATVTCTGNGSTTTTTDANGNYTFNDAANGTYTLCFSKTGYTFTPPCISVTVKNGNVTVQEVTATANHYTISGRVTLNGSGFAGVTVNCTSNDSPVTTDANGYYTFTNAANGSYTVSFSMTGYSFNPTSKQVIVNNGNIIVPDIVASSLSDPVTQLLNSLVHIPAGSFMMGSTDNEYGWAQYTTPVHQVTLQAFDIGAYEVTQAQYLAVMGTNPSYFKGTSYPNSENNPVEQVSWYDARAFCTDLSALTGRTFMLPSEAQWEYACRAGTTTLYSYGDSDALLGDYAWWASNSESQTHPVGTKLPNPWGLFDMHGNVQEWCLDSWHINYTGAPNDGNAWEPETGLARMARGGSWHIGYPGDFLSAARGNADYPDYWYYGLGFRVVEIP
jgi:formylglycine-generating enzyme required for sulfatase activity